MSDVRDYNREAWDHQVQAGNEWTVPVDANEVSRARAGDVRILLTPTKHVPTTWFGNLNDRTVLCLASGGGQQTPLLAAAGANVTVLDNSPAQLAQDLKTAEAHGLQITACEGDMRDLSVFDDKLFDLIVHPCSNCFVPEIRPVWREAHRVLKPGGELLAGFVNPLVYLFDADELEAGRLVTRFRIPYSDEADLTSQELDRLIEQNEPLSFGHSLEDQLGGQTDAGFAIVNLYEDSWHSEPAVSALSDRIPLFMATRSRRLT